MIETKKTEKRYKTSIPTRMLNMYLVTNVLRTWKDTFADEDTGEPISIDRSEILFKRGTLIDQDTLVKIKFFMDAGDIKEVEISNQNRKAYHLENTYMYPYISQVSINGKNKKFLFHACSIKKAHELLEDYIELNYSDGFFIEMIKRFDSCIILTDNLKEYRIDPPAGELFDEPEEEDSDNKQDKKYYQIECKITFDEAGETTGNFVVYTTNVPRAMMLINDYLTKEEDRKEREAKEKNREYEKYRPHATVEIVKPLSVSCFIPEEFSLAYVD